MTLQDFHDDFFGGALELQAYVAAMQPIHRQLLDYAGYLPCTDIARIEISEGQVVLTSRSTGLRLCYADPVDRYGSLTLLNFNNYETVLPTNFFFLHGDRHAALAGVFPG